MFGSVKKMVSAFETRKQSRPPPPSLSSLCSSSQNPSHNQQSPSFSTTPSPVLKTLPCLSTTPEPVSSQTSRHAPSSCTLSHLVMSERCHDPDREMQDVVLRRGQEGRRIPRVRLRDSWPVGKLDCFERNFLSFVTVETKEPISCSKCPPEFNRSRLRPIHCKSTSITELNTTSTTGLNTTSTTGLNTTSTTGLNTTSTTRLNTTSTTGLNTTSTTGLNTTSTTGLITNPTKGLNTTSTTGLNTNSTKGLNTTSTTGLNTNSTKGLNTTSTTGLNATSTTGLNATSTTGLNTTSTTGLNTTSTTGLNTTSTTGLITTSTIGLNTTSTTGLITTSTTGLNATSTTGLNTTSTTRHHSTIGTNVSSTVSTTAKVTGGTYSRLTRETSSKLTIEANANANSPLSLGCHHPVLVSGANKSSFEPPGVPVYPKQVILGNAAAGTLSGERGQGKGNAVQHQLGLRPSDTTFFTLLLLLRSGSSNSMIAIDNKIEQAMDLVKAHLMLAVREEVEVLREQIKELLERNAQLERENYILRALRENQ
ncbi:mucin-5AC isoform X1 [Hemibagrus wyckioides]|uniref:mucin-5AC isoform X1 n=1 Tax=Hemibagrus wyckioides TaxID=337641 RepID=UPI00266D7CB5|nr:mucin-5AC isoform X1 [Hemibagrus wyckioides]